MKVSKLSFVIYAVFIGFASFAQSFSPYIVVDQFGYTLSANKVAIIRDPQTGYDASSTFTPSTTYNLINAANNQPVFSATITAWKNGTTDVSSGDKVWWFDFSSYTTPGKYYVKDGTLAARSAEFVIADTVYSSVLKAAMRMLFYQRSSFPKTTPYAGVGWTDAASHIKPLQDKNVRLYNNKNSSATEQDLHGAWYDAGDVNKYTPWTASYVITLLTAYTENPTIFTDDYNIPESGNGVPDILDEVKWGIDQLLRMQQSNGSCLSVLSSAGASPPSTATGQSVYGPVTTNATLKCAEAFALASKVYKSVNPSLYGTYSTTLQTSAISAWNWGIANPSILFHNNSSSNGSSGVAAGDQETDSLGRFTVKMGAALHLYDLTGQSSYLTIFENNYTAFPIIPSYYTNQYNQESLDIMLFYLSLPGISSSAANNIKTHLMSALNASGDFISALNSETDPYRAFIKDYNWGSNQYKSNYGNLYWKLQANNIDASNNDLYLKSSEEYLHYIHGVNPFGLVYITNMSSYGAENSATQMYHTWFCDGSAKWDQVGVSTYGPPPGFLMGGANNGYTWDKCCNTNCGSTGNTAICTSMSLTPPNGQPQQKSYKDFNTSWPLDSWQLTETSLGYQTAYIRLLSKFVSNATGMPTSINNSQNIVAISVMPNPIQDRVTITIPVSVASSNDVTIDFYSVLGTNVLTKKISNATPFSITELPNGVYVIKVSQDGMLFTDRLVKMQ
jgi:endoglucanase